MPGCGSPPPSSTHLRFPHTTRFQGNHARFFQGRERLQQYLQQNVLHVGYGFPGMMASPGDANRARCPRPSFPETPDAVSRRAVACKVQGVESLQLRLHRRTCLTRAFLSRPEDELSSKQVGQQHNLPSFRENTVDAIKSYPWEKLGLRLSERVLGLVWIPTKWLAIPVFALSAISEFLCTLSTGKDIFIPLGILSGVLLATIIGNACLDVMKELPQDPKMTWPLILLGLFFLLLKLAGPYYLSWVAAFIPHMANAGLVKTALLFRDVPQRSVSS